MLLDVQPFWIVAALISGGFGILVLTLRFRYTANLRAALTWWGLAYMCFAAMFSMLLLWPHSEPLFYVLSRAIAIFGVALEYLAISELKQRPHRSVWIVAPPLAMLTLGGWFTLGHRNLTVDILIFNAIDMLLMALCAYSLLRKEAGQRHFVDSAAGIAFALLAFSTLLVVFWNASSGIPAEFNTGSLQVIFNTIAAIVAEGVIFTLFLLAVTERLNADFKHQAKHDSLTNLLNRRAFEEIGFDKVSGPGRTQRPLSVLMLDIDHFKEINDKHGHAIGDFVLKSVSEALRRSLRSDDYLCRWGGDEFCALLPGATRFEAEKVAARALAAVAGVQLTVDGQLLFLSASVGVASRDEDHLEFALMMNWADVALYRAKGLGRNRFAFA